MFCKFKLVSSTSIEYWKTGCWYD